MFSLNGTLKESGSVGRWETKQFIRMVLVDTLKRTMIRPIVDIKCLILIGIVNMS